MEVDDTSLKIIDATIQVLNEEGLSGTTTMKIAKKAKVSEVTIFRKFKNKNNLIAKSKEAYLQRFLEKTDNLFSIDPNLDLRDYIKQLWIESKKMFEDEMNLIKISFEEINVEVLHRKALAQFSEKIISNLTKIFQNQINKGKIRKINPKMAAVNIYSVMFESLVLLKVYGVHLDQSEDSYVEDFLNIFLNGISIN